MKHPALSHEDNQCLNLGKQVLRMIRDLKKSVQANDTGFARQRITFPGGYVHVFVINDDKLANTLDQAAAASLDVKTITPHSEVM